jgi:DNA-directed RNA polymerase subunit RPC12/RpoP
MTTTASSSASYACGGCGARVEFAAGTTVLRCPYCGHERQVAESGQHVTEHAFASLAVLPRKPVAEIGKHRFRCEKCGAHTESDGLSEQCQFCGAPLVADELAPDLIVPEAVLPFAVDKAGVRTALQAWTSSRWFAPSALKKVSAAESLAGTYLPHWTFDANTESDYTGERGEHYWDTETYTETVDGQTVTRTRQVQRTRWYSARGTVARGFDDILVAATGHVTSQHLNALGPWPLGDAVAYTPDYLAGYQTLRYDTEPETGLETAKARMRPVIEADCRDDIGGDEQRVREVYTEYSDVTFKLLLLPVWIVCYLHAGRSFQVLVNGRTGEVLGERPYSIPKIAAAVAAAILALTLVILIVTMSRHR